MRADPTALLVGYHGMRNLGDDIFLRVACSWLAESRGARRIRVTARRGRIPATLSGAELTAIEPERYPVTGRLRWLHLALEMLRADVVLFAAGSIFTVLPFLFFWGAIAMARMFRGAGLPILALGVSVGPFSNRADRWACRRAFRHFDRVLLRDDASAVVMEAAGFVGERHVSHDLALAWGPGWERAQPVPGRVGVAVSDHEALRSASGGRASVIGEALASLAVENPGFEVVVFSVCTDEVYGDQELSHAMVEAFRRLGVRSRHVEYDGIRPEGVLEKLRSCNAVIASRMHAGLLAMMAGIPVFQIAYARKITDLYAHCGLGREHIVKPEAVDAGALADFTRAALAGRLEGIAASRRAALLRCRGELVGSLRNWAVTA